MSNPKSGNGTAARQYIYCLVNIPFIFLFKIGITGNMRYRLRDINETTFGWCIPVFFCRIWGAYYLEQALLWVLGPLKWQMNGSGGSEWRVLGIIALPIIFLALLIDRIFLFCVAMFVAWMLTGHPMEPIEKAFKYILSWM